MSAKWQVLIARLEGINAHRIRVREQWENFCLANGGLDDNGSPLSPEALPEEEARAMRYRIKYWNREWAAASEQLRLCNEGEDKEVQP